MARMYELLPHTADIKMLVHGRTEKELFVHALASMFCVMQPISGTCVRQQDGSYACQRFSVHRRIALDAFDEESLLVDFLSEALALSETYHEAYFEADFEDFENERLAGTLNGVPIDGFGGVGIKAVTYHDMHLFHDADGWHAEIVFDI